MPRQPTLFMEIVIRFLMPYFMEVTTDIALARAEILETLAAYGARTRSELLNAAQLIAYGLSALETLSEGKAAEMSPSMRLRFRGCANNLNRSGQQHETTLSKRLACDTPNTAAAAQAEPTPAEPPKTQSFQAQPINDIADAAAQAAIAHARAQIAAHRNRLSGAGPAASPQQPAPDENAQRTRQAWGGALIDTLTQMGMPVQPIATA